MTTSPVPTGVVTHGHTHHIAYSMWYVLGTVLCINIPFVGFGAVKSSEHMASHGIFVLCQASKLAKALFHYKRELESADRNAFRFRSVWLRRLFNPTWILLFALLGFLGLFAFMTITGKTNWSGRSRAGWESLWERNDFVVRGGFHRFAEQL